MVTPKIVELTLAVNVLMPPATVNLHVEAHTTGTEQGEIDATASDFVLRLWVKFPGTERSVQLSLPRTVKYPLGRRPARVGSPCRKAL